MAPFPTDADQLSFRRDLPTFFRCHLTLWGSRFSSGLVTDAAWSDDVLERRLPTVRAAFGHIIGMEPLLLHSVVAAQLPADADLGEFAKCEVVSLSAFWATEAPHPVITLAYGTRDDGVYVLAEVLDGAVTAVELNS